jgi:hypothetical protein
MTEYLTGVLNTTQTSNKDLVSVRKHIQECFETVDAFLLPHPGLKVVKKKYDGDFGQIRDVFKKMMRHYLHALFEERLAPKCIHGAYVTADELLEYVKAYTHVFCEAEAFPGEFLILDDYYFYLYATTLTIDFYICYFWLDDYYF